MIKSKDKYVTTAEAAKLLGYTQDHMRKLINRGKIKADKFGQTWLIEKKTLDKIPRRKDMKKEIE